MNKIVLGITVVLVGAVLAGGYFMLGQQDDTADDSDLPQQTEPNSDNGTTDTDADSQDSQDSGDNQEEDTVRPDDENAPPPPPSS